MWPSLVQEKGKSCAAALVEETPEDQRFSKIIRGASGRFPRTAD